MGKHGGGTSRFLPKGMRILHDDRDLLVGDKPAGLLTIGTEREREKTAYFMLTDFVRKGNPKSPNRLFIVHRLDRETSGVLIFAKSEAAQATLQGRWDETEKHYLAIVHGKMQKPEDVISSHLAENSVHIVYSTADTEHGKLARTGYKVLRETKLWSVLDVTALTGRKHQIRVHLAEAGHPIAGDRKYGEGKEKVARLALHAWWVAFPHPYDGRPMRVEASVPAFFTNLAGPMAAPGERENRDASELDNGGADRI